MREQRWKSDLKLEFANFTKSERKVAKYLLEMENEIEKMTVRKCAAGAEVGQPTVVRTVQRIGYQGWLPFRNAVIRQSDTEEVDRHVQEEKITGRRKKDLPTHIIRQDIRMLQEMAAGIDDTVFQEVTGILRRARSVDIFGAERSAFVAGELAGRLLHMGIPCRTYSDLFLQKVSAEYLGDRSVAIAISQSGTTKMIVESMKSAKQRGARTIAIVGTENCPVAEFADFVFVTPNISFEGGEKAASRIAQFALIDLLCEGLLQRDEKRFRENIRKSREKFMG